MIFFLRFVPLVCLIVCQGKSVIVKTTTGLLRGFEENEVMKFKGVRYALPAEGELRWEPPVPFISSALEDTSELGPSCIQQFAFATASLFERVFNTPAPPEREDCLFLNVWAPMTTANATNPVVVWIHGGALAGGTASVPEYDGTSIAANQGIVVVTINYRTNVLGFPSSPELPVRSNNLGFLDQELAFQWVQKNIRQFGGDPEKVTIMGQSAGAESVGLAISRHSQDAPFRAGIMLSGPPVSASPVPSFTAFNAFAQALGCNQTPGSSRIQCLKKIPAKVIRNFINGPTSDSFGPLVDNFTVFDNPVERIRSKETARVPILIGNDQDDGTLFTVGDTNLSSFLASTRGLAAAGVSPGLTRSLYPGLNDTQVIEEVFKDLVFLCPAELWSGAMVMSGISSVFRYSYGAVFADLQLFPGAGAWHSSELPELFGTFNVSTATPAEVTLSKTFQTAFANFIKNPNISPAPNWPRYIPGNMTKTLAKLAYSGNVEMNNFVQLVQSNSLDGPCTLWDQFLDFTA